mgnify:CR=1 FL=1
MKELSSRDRTLLTAQLDEALERDICPICFLSRSNEYRQLDMLLYERINDLGARRKLKRSRGFCVYHTYRLLEVGGYGCHAKIAILFKDLVDDMAQEVGKLNTSRPKYIDMESDCPICAGLRQTEADFAIIMVAYLADAERRMRYGRSFGLCLRHFNDVMARADRSLRQFLRDDQELRLRALSADLGEFVRKSVVQVEPFGVERDVWIRALRLYAGTLKLDERLECEEALPQTQAEPVS